MRKSFSHSQTSALGNLMRPRLGLIMAREKVAVHVHVHVHDHVFIYIHFVVEVSSSYGH